MGGGCLGLLMASGQTRIVSGKFKYTCTLRVVLINNFPIKKVIVPTGTYLGIIVAAYILCSQKDLVVILRQKNQRFRWLGGAPLGPPPPPPPVQGYVPPFRFKPLCGKHLRPRCELLAFGFVLCCDYNVDLEFDSDSDASLD